MFMSKSFKYAVIFFKLFLKFTKIVFPGQFILRIFKRELVNNRTYQDYVLLLNISCKNNKFTRQRKRTKNNFIEKNNCFYLSYGDCFEYFAINLINYSNFLQVRKLNEFMFEINFNYDEH